MEDLPKLEQDLARLASFGCNIADAHSCFIFLPAWMVGKQALESTDSMLALSAFHSLSNDVLARCCFSLDTGLVGWVAKHQRSIHVSPFEHDSRTLGMYMHDQHLKSFIGIPIDMNELQAKHPLRTGVIACDSKKSFAFSKLQGKLLEDLSREVANTLRLSLLCSTHMRKHAAWESFSAAAVQLGQALGNNSIEVLRLKLKNFSSIELTLGTARANDLAEQMFRLVQQALPPHFPCCRLANGDIVIVLDNMMTSFIENKVRAIGNHLTQGESLLEFEFSKSSLRYRKDRNIHWDRLVAETAGASADSQRSGGAQQGVLDYEYRRA